MNVIIDHNLQVVNDINEIYSHAAPHELRALIEKHFIPTKEDKSNNAEIPTPVRLVDEMLNKIPDEFWTTPKTVFEPCCGKGNFVLGIFDKFYEGLKEKYEDEIERCEVIITKCLYYADLTTMNTFITTEILKCHIQSYTGLDELDYKFNSYTGDTLDLKVKESLKIDKFDAVIGNPPYSTDPSKPDSKPLYDKFTEQYIDYGKLLLFVVPSRWFVGGKGLNKFREFMLSRKDIVMITHEDDSKKWFGNKIEIKGGVNYFLKSDSHNDNCSFNGKMYDLNKYNCIIKPEYHEIIDIVKQLDSIDKAYCSSGLYKYRTNDKRYKDDGKIKCYVSSLKSKDRCKYIDSYDFTIENTFWKVITARAAHKAFSGFGTMLIGKPDEIYTDSYISFRVENEDEAKSLMSYLQTKIVDHLLSIRKISQDISENTVKWIPLVPLDRMWNDDTVCEYLKIDKKLYM
jgi:site-specific DNA-methyltransferase (adenine-specific)